MDILKIRQEIEEIQQERNFTNEAYARKISDRQQKKNSTTGAGAYSSDWREDESIRELEKDLRKFDDKIYSLNKQLQERKTELTSQYAGEVYTKTRDEAENLLNAILTYKRVQNDIISSICKKNHIELNFELLNIDNFEKQLKKYYNL